MASRMLKGQHFSITTEFIIGQIPWNKGKKGLTIPWNKGIGKKFNCLACGVSFSPKARGRYAKYCSNRCKGKANSGENNCNWNGGITSEDRLERIKFRKTIQKKVFERDNYTCQICLSKKDLQVDHIQSWKDYIELRFDINNCRTLCMKCHYKITFGKPLPEEIKAWGHNLCKREVSL